MMARIGDLSVCNQHYGVIYADPPWVYHAWGGSMGAADTHYSTMSSDILKALPIADLAAPDCALFLWITWPTMPEALEVASAWGFAYKTCAFMWAKQRSNYQWHMGLGHWTRANTEVCLLFTRGNPQRKAKDVRQLVVTQLGKHSAKPLSIYESIERLVDGPYLELFARRHRPGWDVWGNEAPDEPEHWQYPLFREII